MQLDQLVGSDLSESEALLKTALRLLKNDQPYHAWRLLERMDRTLEGTSLERKLLLAKSFELCGQQNSALTILEHVSRYFPQTQALSSYYLKLLSQADPIPKMRTIQHARLILKHQYSPQETLNAIRILKRLNAVPIGMCHFDGQQITGWLLDAISLPALTVTIDGKDFTLKPFLSTLLYQQKGIGSQKDGFSLQVPTGRYQCIRIHLDGVDLAGSPIYFNTSNSQTRKSPLPSIENPADTTIDIIVPVYKGYVETKACLESVLGTKNQTSYRLLVVDDASPDAPLVNYLDELAQRGLITLLRQPFNSGFVKAVSRGIQASQVRDIILLNADTCVQGDWLDRLRKAAYSDSKIGTVTPLSNNGELVSYPIPKQTSAMPSANLLEKLNKFGALLGAQAVVDIPVGVGFCLYIKRPCLVEAGGVDSGLIERGYCEDTDFCIRAGEKGWRNVCAANVFVAHAGNVSFGTEKSALVAKNVARIYALYPGHSDEYEQFLADDPLLGARNFLQRQLLPEYVAAEAELVVLPEMLDYQSERLKTELDVSQRKLFYLQLKRDAEGSVCIKLQNKNIEQPIDLRYHWPADQQLFWQDLSAAGFKTIDIYRLSDWPFDIIQGISRLNRPYRLFISDYSAYCPQKTLTRPKLGFCNDPAEIEACVDCVKTYGSRMKEGHDIRFYRKSMGQILSKASRVYLSGEDGLDRYRQRFPHIEFQSESDQENKTDYPKNSVFEKKIVNHSIFRIAVLKVATPDDGFFKLLELSRLMAARKINAEFIVFGTSWDDKALISTGKVWVTGKMSCIELPEMIRQHHCSLVFHPVCWPQLDISTVEIARQSGLPLAAPLLGVFKDLLDEAFGDIALNPTQTISEWLSVMIKTLHIKSLGHSKKSCLTAEK